MKVTYRRQVPVQGVPYSAEEVIIEEDFEVGDPAEWVRKARQAAIQGLGGVAGRATVPEPGGGKPSQKQRDRINELLRRCRARKIDTTDLKGPTVAAEAEDLIEVLKRRLETGVGT